MPVVVIVAFTLPYMPIPCIAVVLCFISNNSVPLFVSRTVCPSLAPCLPALQDMMREFLEREKRKQAEREKAKAEKQAAAQQTA